jgi:CubicO group peptidase (beta-lactamase class C family)
MGEQTGINRRSFISLAGAAPLAAALPNTARAQSAIYPGRVWEQIDPAAAGWSMQGLQQAEAQFRTMQSTGAVVIDNGRLVAAWGDTQRPHKIHSARKSFMSTLFGIAVKQGRIDLDWTMQQLRIDDLPPSLTPQEKQARVRDLLMARSGVYHDAAAETRTMKELRPQRGSHPPGTFWYYNNWDFNVVGAILRNITGEDTFQAMERHIARPIGMETFTAANGEYKTVRASQYPAYHMWLTAPDFARFGWLMLNRGRWGNSQVIPADWVAEVTHPWTPEARSRIAYGYMWWVSQTNQQYRTDVGPGSFSARGSGGQILIVAPARGIVVAHLNDQEENEKLEKGQFDTFLQAIFAAAPRTM